MDLVSLVSATDYENWAVLIQCHDQAGTPRFLSTRVLARSRTLSADHWIKAEEAIQAANARAKFR